MKVLSRLPRRANAVYLVDVPTKSETASARRAQIVPPSILTTREAEVYACAADGLSNAEIAATLFITEATVKTHMRNILAKLGLASRSKLMAEAWGATQQGASATRERPRGTVSGRARARAIAAAGAALGLLATGVLVAAPWASSPASSQPLTRSVSGLSVLPFIADVAPIEEMPAAEGRPLSQYLDEGPGPEPVVADVAYLGTRDLYFGIGLLSDTGRVCLNLVVLDPAANPNVSGRRVCSGFAEFTHTGLQIDMGAWTLSWRADGTVNWGES